MILGILYLETLQSKEQRVNALAVVVTTDTFPWSTTLAPAIKITACSNLLCFG